jgi:hypothetical protein
MSKFQLLARVLSKLPCASPRSGWPVLSEFTLRLRISVQPPPSCVMSQYALIASSPPSPSGSIEYTPFVASGASASTPLQLFSGTITAQEFEHVSSSTRFPSSHASTPSWTTESPHFAASQVDRHASVSTSLPSSHASTSAWTAPSPQLATAQVDRHSSVSSSSPSSHASTSSCTNPSPQLASTHAVRHASVSSMLPSSHSSPSSMVPSPHTPTCIVDASATPVVSSPVLELSSPVLGDVVVSSSGG